MMMKTTIKLIAIFLTALFLAPSAKADYDFRSDDCRYRFVEGGVEGDGIAYYERYKTYQLPQTVRFQGVDYTVVGIGSHAFGNMAPNYSWIGNKIKLPERLEYIEEGGLENGVVDGDALPQGLKRIGKSAFEGTLFRKSWIDRIFISKDVTEVGQKAFYLFGRSEQYGRDMAFDLIHNVIEDLIFEDRDVPMEITDQQFTAILAYKITLGEGITKIGNEAFSCNPALLKEYLSTDIDYCLSITEMISFPSTLQSIGEWAFALQPGETAYCHAMVPPSTAAPELYVIGEDCTLYVPEGTREAYAAHPFWSRFARIVDNLPSSLPVISGTDGLGDIRVENGRIIADGRVEVYNMQGALLASGIAAELPVLSPGLYIVRGASKTVKVAVR